MPKQKCWCGNCCTCVNRIQRQDLRKLNPIKSTRKCECSLPTCKICAHRLYVQKLRDKKRAQYLADLRDADIADSGRPRFSPSSSLNPYHISTSWSSFSLRGFLGIRY